MNLSYNTDTEFSNHKHCIGRYDIGGKTVFYQRINVLFVSYYICSGFLRFLTTAQAHPSCWWARRWICGKTVTRWRSWQRTSSAPCFLRVVRSWPGISGLSNMWSALHSHRYGANFQNALKLKCQFIGCISAFHCILKGRSSLKRVFLKVVLFSIYLK